ncbi:MAG: hypothetical protein DHS20C16_04330 [Phycisphaerae bacterium]|nr:MAG: hypothetical protein DHS20C16_04330 [Phycisphaerae bacterium]
MLAESFDDLANLPAEFFFVTDEPRHVDLINKIAVQALLQFAELILFVRRLARALWC